MIVHLIDGTYELFRHFYGARRFTQGKDSEFAAVRGVLNTVLQLLEGGATHVGVATDHVIESFRNELWPGYKTGDGIEPALWAQFHPLEQSLAAMGVAVWPMVELEADDALASAAHLASADDRVDHVWIWTPDKDLAQSVVGERVVQVERERMQKPKPGEEPQAPRQPRILVRDAAGVRAKFGVDPERIPDYLALVGDSADGYPGVAGIGPKGAARLIATYGPIEAFPPDALAPEMRALAILCKQLATLRTDAPLFATVDELRWRGPTPGWTEWSDRLGVRLIERAQSAQSAQSAHGPQHRERDDE